MMRVRCVQALGIALAVLLPAVGEGQMIRRSGTPQRMGGEVSAPMIQRESSLPPVRMGSLPRYNASPVIIDDGYYGGYYNRGYSYGGGRPYSSCYYSSFCRGYTSRAPYIISSYSYVYVDRTYVVGWPWVVLYRPPVYTTFWAPTPAKIWRPASADSLGAAQAGPTKAAPLNTATGGDVMRIESVSDSVARVTWLGTTRPIREARLFLADSVQQSLRGALVDQETPSALLKFADLAPRIAYVGLTITLDNGLIETTLVPYKPPLANKR